MLNQPIVGMAVSRGRRVLAGGLRRWHLQLREGQFYGSTGNIHLNKPVVGMAATPSGNGYWLVASDGGIFSFGDASFYGSTGNLVLNKPIVGMITGPGGAGYFLVASDGGIFSFGMAPFYGSLGGQALKHPIVAAAATPTDNGYWSTDTAGLVSNFGSATTTDPRPSTCSGPSSAWRRPPAHGPFVGGTYPSGANGYDISKFQCNCLRGATHEIGIVQVDGISSAAKNPCLSAGLPWAGGGAELYTFLTYGTSSTLSPGVTPAGGAMPATRPGSTPLGCLAGRLPSRPVVARRRKPPSPRPHGRPYTQRNCGLRPRRPQCAS